MAGIIETSKSLKVLDIKDNAFIVDGSEAEMMRLKAALAACKLETFYWDSYEGIGTREVAEGIAQCSSVTEVVLRNGRGVLDVSPLFHMTALKKLTVCSNDWGNATQWLRAGEALQELSSLEELCLETPHSDLGVAPFTAFVEAVKSSPSLRVFAVEHRSPSLRATVVQQVMIDLVGNNAGLRTVRIMTYTRTQKDSVWKTQELVLLLENLVRNGRTKFEAQMYSSADPRFLESEDFRLLIKQVEVEGILNDVGRGELRRQGAGHRHRQALMKLGELFEDRRFSDYPDPIIAVSTLFGFFKENPTLFDGLSSRLPPTTRPKTPPRPKRRRKRLRT